MGNFLRIVIIGVLLFGLPLAVWAESSSANYTMWAHAFTGGGQRGTSTNYIGFGTVGDLGGTDGTSTNYILNTGFQELELDDNSMTFTLSSVTSNISPDPITTSGVSSGSVIATVGTYATHGYTLTATKASAFQNQNSYALTDVSDGAVTAGNEEFGIAASGDNASFSDDRAVTTSPLTVASKSSSADDVETTITFKAAIDANSEAGAYSGQITFIATSNF